MNSCRGLLIQLLSAWSLETIRTFDAGARNEWSPPMPLGPFINSAHASCKLSAMVIALRLCSATPRLPRRGTARRPSERLLPNPKPVVKNGCQCACELKCYPKPGCHEITHQTTRNNNLHRPDRWTRARVYQGSNAHGNERRLRQSDLTIRCGKMKFEWHSAQAAYLHHLKYSP